MVWIGIANTDNTVLSAMEEDLRGIPQQFNCGDETGGETQCDGEQLHALAEMQIEGGAGVIHLVEEAIENPDSDWDHQHRHHHTVIVGWEGPGMMILCTPANWLRGHHLPLGLSTVNNILIGVHGSHGVC